MNHLNTACLLFIACLASSMASPNAEIVVKDKKGNVYTSYSVEQYETPVTLSCSMASRYINWSIAPQDKGVTMYDDRINIDTSKILPKTVFTITAVDGGLTNTLDFEIEVYGCKYGSFTHIQKDTSDDLFRLYLDSELLYNGTFSDKYFCLPRGTFRYASQSNKANYLIITNEDGGRLHTYYFAAYSKFEGTFSNVLDAPIAISFPSVVSVLPNVAKTLLISTSGLVDSVKVEPELRVDSRRFTVQISRPSIGTTTYTITASHGSQSTQKTFTVYCGSCPKDTTLVTAIPDNRYVLYSLPEVEGPITTDMAQSFCLTGSSFTLNYQSTKDTPLVLSKEGHVFYEYYVTASDMGSAELHVEWRTPVAFTTPIPFFAGSPSKNWNQPNFDAKGWQQGSEGNWGASASAASSLFFRAPFTLDAEAGVTNVIVFLHGEGSVEVFINGVSFGLTILRTANSTSVAIPVSYAVPGNNVVGVRLARSVSSAVLFGLSVELNNAPFLRLIDGVASEIQTRPSEYHKPADAFGWDENAYWSAQSFPAELIFTFDAPQVVNKVRISHNPFWRAFSIKFVGVSGSERVELATWNKDAVYEASTGFDSSTLSFVNTRPFKAYHFVVESNSEYLNLAGIRMYHDAQYACPKKWGYKNALEGTTFFKRCPLGYTGRRARSCVHQGMGAQWEDSKAQCFGTNPPKGSAYVDWEFTLTSVTRSVWEEKARDAFIAMLTENTYLRTGDVSFLYMDNVMDGKKTVLKVFARCTVMSLMGKVIEYNLDDITPKFAELVAAKLGAGYGGSIDKVTLRPYVNWAMVIIVSVVVVVVTAAIGGYIYVRNKSGSVKSLHKRANNDETLLVLGVCSSQ